MYLSQNIKYLRKEKKLSQNKLATILGVKRSNIASYESKNIEPKLPLLIKIAEYFDIDLVELITVDIIKNKGKQHDFHAYKTLNNNIYINENYVPIEQIQSSWQRSIEIKKMLEGFKIFFKFKLDKYKTLEIDSNQLTINIENVLDIMEQLQETNTSLLSLLSIEGITTNKEIALNKKST